MLHFSSEGCRFYCLGFRPPEGGAWQVSLLVGVCVSGPGPWYAYEPQLGSSTCVLSEKRIGAMDVEVMTSAVSVSVMTTVVDCAVEPKILYGCMLQNKMETCLQFTTIFPDRYGTYTGLRQSAHDAFEREQMNHNWQLQPKDVTIFSVKFSLLGWMHVTTTMRGSVPLLQRMTYSDGIDYGVWHFNASLPLRCETPTGELLFEVIFHPAA